jgi:large conductance mechanosensitive channel
LVLKEFRDFALRGNAVDLVREIFIGAVSGARVSSLGDDVSMPLVNLIAGRVDFSNLFIVLDNPNSVPMVSMAAARDTGRGGFRVRFVH